MSAAVEISPAYLLGVAAALASAHAAGVTDALDTTPTTPDVLARRLGVAERPLRLVLDVMASLDLAERHGGAYAAGPALRALQRAIPGGMLADARLWAHLPRWLRDDRPITGLDAGAVEREPLYAGVVASLGALWTSAARAFAARLGRCGPRVVDVGCGSGVWSLALAEHDPDVHVTGVDFAAVLEVFAARARTLGLADRVTLRPGDASDVAVPPGHFDTVVVANVLRLEVADRARALVHRWARGVAPGGRLIVIDALAGGTPAAERARAFYALHLGIRSADATVHAPDAIRQWLDEAGLEPSDTFDLRDGVELGALGAIVARRAG